MATKTIPAGASNDDTHSTSGSLGRHNTPPFWSKTRQRAASNISYQSVQLQRKRMPIMLEDNTEESTESTKSVWAKQVTIDEHTVISGNSVGAGAYVVWSCTVDMLDVCGASQCERTGREQATNSQEQGGQMKLRKRYSEFDELRQRLAKTFPQAAKAMPPLPPKSFVSRFRARFLQKRGEGLAYFLKYVVITSSTAQPPADHRQLRAAEPRVCRISRAQRLCLFLSRPKISSPSAFTCPPPSAWER